MNRFIVVVALISLLSACVTATPYQPAEPRGFGYSEERLDQNKYRVSFKGNSLTRRETVEDYLLYRAAELNEHFGSHEFPRHLLGRRAVDQSQGGFRTSPTQPVADAVAEGQSFGDSRNCHRLSERTIRFSEFAAV